MLRLQKTFANHQLAFVGTRFYDADVQYSKDNFQRPVIELSMDGDLVARKLGEIVSLARKQIRPKRHTLDQLHQEEMAHLREHQLANARKARERETFRQRFLNIQSFIDSQFIR